MTSVAIVGATVVSYGVGWLIGWPPLVPILNTLAGYPFMVVALRRGELRLGIVRMLVWAAALGVCSTLLSFARPAATDLLFIRGAAYRAEMFAWVMTGHGAESTPSLFIPQQLGHAVVLVAIALVTGGAAAMAMGAVLMNYMGHYVGALGAASAHPAATMVLAWVPWAIIRVISFVVLGVVMAVPLVSGVGVFSTRMRDGWKLAAWAVGGLAADIVLKTLLAPAWQRMLLRVVGW